MNSPKHLDNKTDEQFHHAVHQQGYMIIAFILALAWIMIAPFELYPFGYIFLMAGGIMLGIHKRKKYKTCQTAG